MTVEPIGPAEWGTDPTMNDLEAMMWRAEADPRLRSTGIFVDQASTVTIENDTVQNNGVSPGTGLASFGGIVLAGASGIGRALCRRFAAEGAQGIVVSDVNEAGAAAVAAEVKGLAVRCDCRSGQFHGVSRRTGRSAPRREAARPGSGRGSGRRDSGHSGPPARSPGSRALPPIDADQVAKVAEPVIHALNLDLEGIRITAAGRRRLLRLVVDGDGGVSLDATA